MFKKLHCTGIYFRIMILMIMVAASFVATILFYFIPVYENELLRDRRMGLRNVIQAASSLLYEYEARVIEGEFDRSEAQARAMKRLKHLRYGNNEYIWINNYKGNQTKVLMHAAMPALEGRVLAEEQFNTVARLQFGFEGPIKEIPQKNMNILAGVVEVVSESGSGFVNYQWQRPTDSGVTEVFLPKESFVKLFEPWGWVLGTGLYIDDIYNQTAKLRWATAGGTTLIMLVVLFFASLINSSITRPFLELVDYAEQVSEGNLDVKVSKGYFTEEARLRSAITHMVGELRSSVRKAEQKTEEAEKIQGELRKSEELLRELNEELKKKNFELEQILYVTSHDLRSPLVNINGYSREVISLIDEINQKIASTNAKPDISPQLHETKSAMEYVVKSSVQMDTLLKGLLRFSRLGRTALEIENICMNEAVKSIVQSFDYQLQEKGIKVEIEQLPDCVGDKIQINQIFTNLIGNAIKYMRQNTSGLIRVYSIARDDEFNCYCISDNGIGMAPEHLSRIFELFHRLDPDSTSGEGLGLSIASQAAKRLKGNIIAESEPGKGSRFMVTLPGC